MNHNYRILWCFLALTGILFPQENEILIRSLELTGNQSISEKEILFIVRQKSPNIIYRRPVFDSRLLKLDALSLKNYYHSKGFLDVYIEESYTTEDGYVDIHFKIEEGKQYSVSAADIKGNKVIPSDKILSLLGIKTGKTYNPVKVNENIPFVENEYHELGKLFLSMEIKHEITDSAALSIMINEGKDVTIQKTHFEGIENIDTMLVHRELLYGFGEKYKKSVVDKTAMRIRETGVFSMVNFVPVRKAQSDSLVDLVIELKPFKQREWNSAGGYDPIRFAEGAEPITAISGTIEWKNRSIFESPTQFSTKLLAGIPVEEEFVRHRIRYDISFSTNWILDVRFPSRFTSYYETFIEYKDSIETIDRYGINLTQKVRFFKRSFFETNAVWESFSDNSEKKTMERRSIEQRSIAMKIHIDKRNNPLFTRNGFLLNGVLKSSGYFLGGERDYIKADISIQGYIPLGRRSVFAIRLKTGHIWDWNPDLLDYSFEKFYLGGSTSMRGWDVLRFKEISGDPWGDIFRFMTNVEYRFPIYRSIGMTVFSDGGVLSSTIATISMQDIQWDGGIGITVNTPLGPARLDYAVQFDPPRSGKIQLGVQSLF